MSGLNAGEVYALLGGKFDRSGFVAFDKAVHQSRDNAAEAEQRIKIFGDRSSASLHAVGKAAKVGAGAGILGLTAIIGYSVKSAADFESQLDQLATASSATGRQMGQLKKQAMDAGAATKFSALEAAKAQTELSKGGLSVTKILGGGLKGALALAAAGNMDLADAATTTANALNLFKLNGSESVHVADALATAANSTTADVADFAIALTQGGAAAKAAGMDFDQTVTFLEALANAGVKGSDAGTSMKAALTQIASPTKQSAEAMKKLNIEFFDAQGKIKPLPAIAKNLDEAFGGLTNQQRLQAASTIAGTDGMRGLLALYDASPAALRKLEDGLAKQGTAAEVAAKNQDNLKGKIENFKGSIETAGIALGEKFLPMLTRGAEQATALLNHLSATGQIDRFADGLVKGAETGITVVKELAHVIGDVAHAAAPVAGVLLDVGQALDLGDPGHIEAILAAIIGFKVAGAVAPMVMDLANAVRLLSTAPTAAALAGDLVAMVNPLTAVMVGAGLAAGALVLLSGKSTADARAARENAAAHKAQAEAIKSVRDAERAAADDGLAAQQSSIDEDRAKAATRAAAKGPGGKSSAAYKEALIAERQAVLRAKDAHDAYNSSIDHQNKSNQKNIDTAKERVAATNKEVEAARRQVEASSTPIKTVGGQTIQRAPRTGDIEAAKVAQERQTEAVQAYIQAVAHANVSDQSRQRLMHGASQITEENVQGISHLIDAMDGLPTKKQTRFLLTGSQSALAELGGLAAQLTSLGRKRTVARVLATADSASAAVLAFRAILTGVPLKKVARILAETKGKAEIDALKAAIAGVNGKSVAIDVTTRYKQIGVPAPGTQGGGATRRAAGRGRGGSETALVGEGSHAREAIVDPARGTAMVVDQPTIMDLSDTAYVIPEDPKRRGRAMGLLAELAKDLGLKGFAPGRAAKKKKPAKKKRYVPSHLDPLSLPVDDFETREGDARKKLNDTKKKVHDLPGTISDDQKRVKDIRGRAAKTAATKAKKARDLKKAQADLAAHRKSLKDNKVAETRQRAEWKQREQELKDAKAYAAKIQKQRDLADIAADQMRLADGKDDDTAYEAAKKRRATALGALHGLLAAARKHVPADSVYGRSLDKDISGAEVEQQDTDTSEIDIPEPDEPDLTAAQKALLARDEKDISLAALTETLDDDKTTAGTLATDLQGILTSLTSGAQPASDSLISEVADRLKSAQDNVKSLNGTGTNDNPDLQAQLDQANERTRVANENARINRQALEVFAGSGDIGVGGSNARNAVNTTVVFQSYVPPSPGEAARLAGYVNSGNDLQGSRESKRETVA